MHSLFTSRQHMPVTAVLLLMLSAPLSALESPAVATIEAVMNDFHLAAAEADEARYLGHFAPEGVFMGTDDWERWPLPAFAQYVKERFAGGTGWTYTPEERFVTLGPRGESAWIDEIVVSERWGRFRGTGVLLRVDGRWKIAHYSLTMLVPNDSFADVAATAMAGFAKRQAASDGAEPESAVEEQ